MLGCLRGEINANEPVVEEKKNDAKTQPFARFETEDIRFMYCTEFIVQRSNDKDPALLMQFLSTIGDSAVVVDDEELIKVHVHTNEPGEVITKALGYGSLLRLMES